MTTPSLAAMTSSALYSPMCAVGSLALFTQTNMLYTHIQLDGLSSVRAVFI